MEHCLYHLPGLAETNSYISPVGAPPFLKFPSLYSEALALTIKHILNARNNHLKNCDQHDIISAIDTIARKWLDPENRWRKMAIEKLLQANSFSREIVENGINNTFTALLKENLKDLIFSEIGKEPILDQFCRVSKRYSLRAYGPSLIFHISSGNIPGIAVRSLAYGMLAKSANFIKVSENEGILTPLFVKSLAELYPELAESIAVTWWPGGEESLENVVFAASDHVVVYGNDETIESVRSRIPLRAKLHSHGNKFSMVVIGKEKLTLLNLAHLSNCIALDMALYDQKGCFSPQIVYMEKGSDVTPLEFVKSLGDALDNTIKSLPEIDISQEEGAKIAQLRLFYTMKSVQGLQTFVLQSDKGGKWTVVLDEDFNAVSHSTYRFIVVKPIDALMQLADILSPFKGKISVVGTEIDETREENIASIFGELGVFRITPIGCMQTTPMHWHHDGRFNILDFLHFVELEQ